MAEKDPTYKSTHIKNGTNDSGAVMTLKEGENPNDRVLATHHDVSSAFEAKANEHRDAELRNLYDGNSEAAEAQAQLAAAYEQKLEEMNMLQKSLNPSNIHTAIDTIKEVPTAAYIGDVFYNPETEAVISIEEGREIAGEQYVRVVKDYKKKDGQLAKSVKEMTPEDAKVYIESEEGIELIEEGYDRKIQSEQLYANDESEEDHKRSPERHEADRNEAKFENGQDVTVQRTNGDIEHDWYVVNPYMKDDIRWYKVAKKGTEDDPRGRLVKAFQEEDLIQLQQQRIASELSREDGEQVRSKKLDMTNREDFTSAIEQVINEAYLASPDKLLTFEEFEDKYIDQVRSMLADSKKSLPLVALMKSIHESYMLMFNNKQSGASNEQDGSQTSVEGAETQDQASGGGDTSEQHSEPAQSEAGQEDDQEEQSRVAFLRNPIRWMREEWQMVKSDPEKRKKVRNGAIGALAVGAVGIAVVAMARNNPSITEMWNNIFSGLGGEGDPSAVEAASQAASGDVPNGALDSTVGDQFTEPPEIIRPDEVGGGPEFPDAAQEVEPGEGFYQTYDDLELNLTDSQKQALLNKTGPELQRMGVAYPDATIGGYGITEPGKMPDRALSYMVDTAKNMGFIR